MTQKLSLKWSFPRPAVLVKPSAPKPVCVNGKSTMLNDVTDGFNQPELEAAVSRCFHKSFDIDCKTKFTATLEIAL